MNDISTLYIEHIKNLKSKTENILQEKNLDGLIVASGFLDYYLFDDHPVYFKSNPYFNHWVPLGNNPNCFLIFTPGKVPEILYYHPDDFWHKVAPLPDDFWVFEFDLKPIKNLSEGIDYLKNLKGNFSYIGPERNELPFKTNEHDVLNFFNYHRGIKSNYELACLKKANHLAAKAHKQAYLTYLDKTSEFEIHQQYLKTLNIRECELPYNNIIALNQNGAILHYSDYEKTAPEVHHSFLIDAGASFNGYHSDITRTYTEIEEFQVLIDLMNKAQMDLVEGCQIGSAFGDLHALANEKIGEILSEVGIVKGGPKTEIARYFFPHGLGHPLGLQVHDVGAKINDEKGAEQSPPIEFPNLRCTKTLEEGNVVTIEPGLYFIDLLLHDLKKDPLGKEINWDKVEGLKKFGGIRIEDDVWVGENGPKNLTRIAFERT
ncbi:MAG: Xaa-Pro dipeptidase [Epsilonproteobacteria bacterium]|nr:MAG: Xaa-Pro dipeptidase [Campylobacterota bacterium]